VVRDIPENGVALAEEMKRRNLDFTNRAADLAVFTSRFVPKKQDESKLSADQYWHAHPELSEERYRPHRAAGDAESLRRAKAEVERFLASKIGLQYV